MPAAAVVVAYTEEVGKHADIWTAIVAVSYIYSAPQTRKNEDRPRDRWTKIALPHKSIYF